VSDYAPRIAAYNRLKDAGYSDLEAGYLSLEATGNYTRHGEFVKDWNQYSPFFNDHIQGADRFIRAMKRDPAGMTARAVALITIPQLIISGYYLFAADDDTRDEYLNRSDYERGVGMGIKINGNWISIPRAFAPGFAFGALPEQAMIHYFGGEGLPELKNFWLRMIGNGVSSLSPATDWTQTLHPLLKSAIESTVNYSFFRQTPLFHGDTKTTAPENQFNAHTSETAKAIAASSMGKMFGISPVNLENTIYDMTANIGKYAEQLGDIAINGERRATGQPINERATTPSDNPIYGRFIRTPPVGTNSESYQEFNEHFQDLAQQNNRYQELKDDDKADFADKNANDLALYPEMQGAEKQVRDEEHQIRLVTENADLSGSEKAEQIAEHQKNIQTIVEGANATYRAGKEENQ
jgi:hypothetical protein